MGLTLPFDPTSSPQAARMAWAIERYAEGTLTPEQVEATHEFDPGYDVESQLRRFRIFRRPIDEVVSYEPDPVVPRALVRSGRDMALVAVRVGDAPQHRILAMSLAKCPAAGVTTRVATDADGPALRDLERRCAIEAEGVAVHYDRSDDYFAQQRLMAQHQTSVAEYEGRIVGVISDAVHPIRVAGVEYRSTYRFHLRVDPAARGLGIFPALNVANSRFLFAQRPLPVASSFVAAGNEQMDETLGPDQRANRWPTPVECMVLPCRELAGPSHGRATAPADATRIADLLAASHAGEELALDFDEAWVERRLTRSPRDYSWPHVRLSKRAVLGVWDSGLRIVRVAASGTTTTRTASVLDWGFAPGAEAEMEALLRSACSTLATAGVDDLTIFTSPPSRGRSLLADLARAVRICRVSTAGIRPRSPETTGTYVDPVYF
jgi:GNAT superfamily N-acetyltransferase